MTYTHSHKKNTGGPIKPAPKLDTKQDVLALLMECMADGFIPATVRTNLHRVITFIRTHDLHHWHYCDHVLPVINDAVFAETENGAHHFATLNYQNEFVDLITGQRIENVTRWSNKKGSANVDD